MFNKKICIIDDDQKLINLIKKYLAKNSFENVESLSAQEIINLKNIDFDLIILDIMMPGIDGFEVCRHIRKISQVFIIFLSAKTESFDKVLGLEMGADDYLTKPFEPRELLARINSLFRRKDMSGQYQTEAKGNYTFNEFTLNMDKQQLILNNKIYDLTTYEYVLLCYLCKNANIILSRRQIEQHLEDNEFISYGRNVDIGISRLRKKLEKNTKKPELLKTIWGRGYQLAATRKD